MPDVTAISRTIGSWLSGGGSADTISPRQAIHGAHALQPMDVNAVLGITTQEQLVEFASTASSAEVHANFMSDLAKDASKLAGATTKTNAAMSQIILAYAKANQSAVEAQAKINVGVANAQVASGRAIGTIEATNRVDSGFTTRHSVQSNVRAAFAGYLG